jgi:hypothetical protein
MTHTFPRIIRCATKGTVTTYTMRGTSGRVWEITVRKGMIYDNANNATQAQEVARRSGVL